MFYARLRYFKKYRLVGFRRPFPERLSKQRDGRHNEQHETVIGCFSFCDFQSGKGFA